MSEKNLEKPICQTCGADVRPGALFCFSCGSSVETVDSENTGHNGKGHFQLREESIREDSYKNSAADVKIEEIPIERPLEDPFALPVGKNNEAQDRKFAADGKLALKTAASLRKRNRTAQKKKIEVVWEPSRDKANIWFVIAALFFLLVAVGILVAMLYIR